MILIIVVGPDWAHKSPKLDSRLDMKTGGGLPPFITQILVWVITLIELLLEFIAQRVCETFSLVGITVVFIPEPFSLFFDNLLMLLQECRERADIYIFF